MAAAVRLERVCYRYPGSDWVLQDVELDLDAGEYAVVFGANGSGKSSFAYLLNGLIPHFFGGSLQGLVQVGALSTRDCATADLFHRVGLVLQNPDAQLFSSTVADELAFGLESLGLPALQIEERILATAAALGIEDSARAVARNAFGRRTAPGCHRLGAGHGPAACGPG